MIQVIAAANAAVHGGLIMTILLRPFRAVAASLVSALMLLGAGPTFAQSSEGPPQRVIVKWRAGGTVVTQGAATAARDQAISEARSSIGVTTSNVRVTANGAQVVKLDQRVAPAALQSFIATLASNPAVEYVEEDRLMRRLLAPNDSRYNEQWHYFENTAGLRLPSAWDITTGTGVTVAVLDTGYRPHPDLAGNIVGGYDFISDTFVANDGNGRDSNAQDPGDWNTAGQCPPDPNAYPSSWHGTHVSGTIGALSNNSSGVAGVAFGARVLPLHGRRPAD